MAKRKTLGIVDFCLKLPGILFLFAALTGKLRNGIALDRLFAQPMTSQLHSI